jgi:pyrrolidone-carboxylate peptidase
VQIIIGFGPFANERVNPTQQVSMNFSDFWLKKTGGNKVFVDDNEIILGFLK